MSGGAVSTTGGASLLIDEMLKNETIVNVNELPTLVQCSTLQSHALLLVQITKTALGSNVCFVFFNDVFILF